MINTEINKNKSIYGIEKNVFDNKILLKWKSSGLSEFLVFYSETKEQVLFEGKLPELLSKTLAENKDKFFAEKKIALKNETNCFYITLDELKRDGGLPIKNRPGFYSVYGCASSCDDLTVYVDGTDHPGNIFFMTVDVVIRNIAVSVTKGFLRKKNEYSGYHQITLSYANPSLVGGLLKYSIDGYEYPFPDEVVKNGGSFFVQANEQQQIGFETAIQGIIIK